MTDVELLERDIRRCRRNIALRTERLCALVDKWRQSGDGEHNGIRAALEMCAADVEHLMNDDPDVRASRPV